MLRVRKRARIAVRRQAAFANHAQPHVGLLPVSFGSYLCVDNHVAIAFVDEQVAAHWKIIRFGHEQVANPSHQLFLGHNSNFGKTPVRALKLDDGRHFNGPRKLRSAVQRHVPQCVNLGAGPVHLQKLWERLAGMLSNVLRMNFKRDVGVSTLENVRVVQPVSAVVKSHIVNSTMKKPNALEELIEDLKANPPTASTAANLMLPKEAYAVVFPSADDCEDDDGIRLNADDCSVLFCTPATVDMLVDVLGNVDDASVLMHALDVSSEVLDALERSFSSVDEV